MEQYCELINPDSERALCETRTNLDYRLTFRTTNLPVALCCLEKYVDAVEQSRGVSLGRRTDFLAVGRYHNVPYVIFIELRRVMTSDEQLEDKIAQVEQTMRLFCRENPGFGAQHHAEVPEIFTDAADPMQNHRFIGAIVPVERAKPRYKQQKIVSIGEKRGVILPVSPERRGTPMLSWDDLLTRFGVK